MLDELYGIYLTAYTQAMLGSVDYLKADPVVIKLAIALGVNAGKLNLNPLTLPEFKERILIHGFDVKG